MDKKQTKTPQKQRHPRKYGEDVVSKVVALIKEGKTMPELLEAVPCRKRAILRMARKQNLAIKK